MNENRREQGRWGMGMVMQGTKAPQSERERENGSQMSRQGVRTSASSIPGTASSAIPSRSGSVYRADHDDVGEWVSG
jgi:hypothetical protein